MSDAVPTPNEAFTRACGEGGAHEAHWWEPLWMGPHRKYCPGLVAGVYDWSEYDAWLNPQLDVLWTVSYRPEWS